jgi:hypothetical protein
MTCAEFQQVLPDVMEGSSNVEQKQHLQSCQACAGLVSDLKLISEHARSLQATEEPRPRVWSALEMALKQEGLIRQPQRDRSIISAFSRRWNPAWLIPVAAALLVGMGTILYKQVPSRPNVANNSASQSLSETPAMAAEDRQLLESVGSRAPAMKAAYEASLQNVNAYIRDAQATVESNPNDEEARESLMDAYEQRAMVYEMALDRSLP